MRFFLAQIRRIFLAGCVTLAIAVFMDISPSILLNSTVAGHGFSRYFSIYILISPILFVLFTVVSTIYIRRCGQFAEVHKKRPFIVSLLQSVGHDLISPFKNIGGMLKAMFGKWPDVLPDDMKRSMKRHAKFRFLFMTLVIIVCFVGIGSFL